LKAARVAQEAVSSRHRQARRARPDELPASKKVTQFAYMARYTGRTVERDLAEIADKAKRNNERLGITGVLVYDAGVFIQVLEGPNDAVTHMMTRILSDQRADNVAILFYRLVDQRELGHWSMLTLRLDRSGIGPFSLETFRRAYQSLSAGGDLDGFIDAVNAIVREEAESPAMTTAECRDAAAASEVAGGHVALSE